MAKPRLPDNKRWKAAFERLEASRTKQAEAIARGVDGSFKASEKVILDRIEAWYARIARNNGITSQEARKLLDRNELKEFRWTVQEYIKAGKHHGGDPAVLKQLENASAKTHISRLESLEAQIKGETEVLYARYKNDLSGHLIDLYSDQYYHTAFEIQRGIGVGWTFDGVNQRKIEKIIQEPWASDHFNLSERLGLSKSRLIETSHRLLTQMVLTGDNPDRYIKQLAKELGISRRNAGRVIMTESAYYGQLAQQDAYEALGVEEYEIIATLDNITSPICREMDGQHFKMSEYEIGVTAPPFHPWCRTTTAPYFSDQSIVERIAKDKDGQNYYVDGSMTYKEWAKKYPQDAGRRGKRG